MLFIDVYDTSQLESFVYSSITASAYHKILLMIRLLSPKSCLNFGQVSPGCFTLLSRGFFPPLKRRKRNLCTDLLDAIQKFG